MLDNLQEYFETPIEIVFSKKRKTISIQIKPDSIRVLSTYWISKNSVREFILKNESWIRTVSYTHLTLPTNTPV